MKLTLDDGRQVYRVRSYGNGKLRIGENVYQSSVVVTADHLIDPWRPRTVDELLPADFEPILELQPAILLLGTGPMLKFPDAALLTPLYGRRLGVEVMDTGAACRTFNVLVGEGRNVAAALMV